MKSETEIERMRDFFGFFNDGRIMNQEYRRGIMDALAWVRGHDGTLDMMLSSVKEIVTKEGE